MPDSHNSLKTDSIAAVVRLHREPCVYYSESTIHETLMNAVCPFMDFLQRFYAAWAQDAVAVRQPTKQVFETACGRGDWRVMPCVIEGDSHNDCRLATRVAAVKIIGTNEEQRIVRDKISVGKALLVNPTDNYVEAIFDVAALSSFRTAALSVLAYKYCGYSRHHVAAIVGAGRIGFYTAVILQQWLGVGGLLVHDMDLSRTKTFLSAVAHWYGSAAQSDELGAVRQGSQAIFLATTSQQPIFTDRLSSAIRFIASVGADAENLSELTAEAVHGRIVISESDQNMGFGDLRRWHSAGTHRPEDLVLLPSVIRAHAHGDPLSLPAAFISTGTAVQDALICRFLHDHLNGRGGALLEDACPSL